MGWGLLSKEITLEQRVDSHGPIGPGWYDLMEEGEVL